MMTITNREKKTGITLPFLSPRYQKKCRASTASKDPGEITDRDHGGFACAHASDGSAVEPTVAPTHAQARYQRVGGIAAR